jgi:hypothetical protein
MMVEAITESVDLCKFYLLDLVTNLVLTILISLYLFRLYATNSPSEQINRKRRSK